MNNWQMSLKDPATIVEGMEDIAQSIYLVLATVKGSDPLRPDFGSDLYMYLDRPLAENKPGLIYSIIEAIDKWEKRVQVKKCQVTTDGVGTLKITLYIELNGTGEQKTITINV